MAIIRKIETERLVIEPAFIVDKSKEFAKAIYEAGEFEWYFGLEETNERLKEISIKRKGYYNIFDKMKNFIGYLGFYRQDGDYEIEIYILKEYRRKGYAEESLKVMLGEAFEGNIIGTRKEDFTRIVSSVRKENLPSRMLLEKCGFEPNQEIAEFCMLFHISPEDDELGKPIILANYYITRDKFMQMY